ncbi:MAG TPA: 4-hydroxy-tetrahydrodipicolinate synthase [Trueperaceae bacterium]
MNAPKGSIVPLITPFAGADAHIDEAALRECIEFQIREGSHGLSTTGTTGEPSSLSMDERKFMIDFVLREARGRLPVVPGTGTNNLDETLELTRYAAKAGADAVLVISPYYVRPNQRNLFAYFRRIADSVPNTPFILYNIPGRTAVNIEPETIGRLREACPNIIGVKQATRDLDQVSYTLIHAGRDFAVYCGLETMTYPMLALGGSGHVNATAMVAPREVAELYDLAAAGRWDECRDLHYRMLELNDMLFLEVNPVPLKTALSMMGLCEPIWRLPLGPMLPDNETKLRATLAKYGIVPGAGVNA